DQRRRAPSSDLMPATPSFIEHFAPVARDYDVVLCDVWGVVHNGVAAFADACEALTRFRAAGGTALLITHAPRPAGVVGPPPQRAAAGWRGGSSARQARSAARRL